MGTGARRITFSLIRDHYLYRFMGSQSIGRHGRLDLEHLNRLKAVVDRYEPGLVSEHLAWSTHDSAYFPDLLPVPYTSETSIPWSITSIRFKRFWAAKILENPSTYILFETSTMSEVDFLTDVVRRRCGLLRRKQRFRFCDQPWLRCRCYLEGFPIHNVGRFTLAGHAEDRDEVDQVLLIDSHDRSVAGPVWDLYARVLQRTGPIPTLIGGIPTYRHSTVF